ncbi:1,4-dihydroxy-2-naphthoate octaprenyltransferase [Halomonas shantousis]
MHAITTVTRSTRPNFLLLAPLCVLLGIAVTTRQLVVSPADIALIVLGALCAHAAVNLLNEYDDFRSGLDLMTRRTPFSGGSGALPATPGAARGVGFAGLTMLAATVLIGIRFLWTGGFALLVIGLAGLILVVTYTRWLTRSPFLCLIAPGLGFGPVMVLGTTLALGGQLDATAVFASLVAMALTSELLLVNQFPDIDADRRIGRRHLPIVLGIPACARIASGLLIGAYLGVAAASITGIFPLAALIALLPLPAALRVAWQLRHADEGPRYLLPVLGLNVATLLGTLLLLGLALLLG